MDPQELGRLAELVRLGEQAMDRQLAVLESQDQKSRQLLLMGMALLPAGAIVAGQAARPMPWVLFAPFALLMLAFICLLLRALDEILRSYLGSSKRPVRLAVGWSGEHLVKAGDEGWDIALIHRSSLEGQEDWMRRNGQVLDKAGRLRRKGFNSLLLAAAFLVVSFIYVVMANAF